MNKQQQHCLRLQPKPPGEGGGGLNNVTGQIFALDSVVVKHKMCLARMDVVRAILPDYGRYAN